MSKKYIFIDSNIYIFCSTLTKDDKYSSELIDKLKSVLNDNKDIVLLVPEIVKFEYERVSKDLLQIKQRNIVKLDDDINKGNSGLSDSEKKKIIIVLGEIMKNTQENHKKVNSSLQKIFNSKTTHLIEVTPQILTNAYKRAIAGKKPFSIKKEKEGECLNNPINADCVIFETILDFFTTHKIQKGDKLFFCTNNISDFSDGTENLSLDMVQELPVEVSFYSSFPKMIENEFNEKVSKETMEKYQHLTEKTLLGWVLPTQEFYAVAVTPNQLGVLNGLGVNMFTSDVVSSPQSLGTCISPNNILIDQSKNSCFTSGINQSILGMNPYSTLSSVRVSPDNQLKCVVCGSVFERSFTDPVFNDKCQKCRGYVFLGNK